MRLSRIFYLCLVMALVLSLTTVAFAEEKTVKLVIPELCASNSTEISEAIAGFENVKNVELDVENTQAFFTSGDGVVDLDALKKILADMAYPVTATEEVK